MDTPNIGPDEELALVFDAPNHTTAQLVCSSLRAAGLRSVLLNEHSSPAAGWLNYLGNAYSHGVLVPASEVEAARSILDEERTEEEITAAVDTESISPD
jgi:hypothetical protein